MKSPCYNCPDRHQGCHSECEKYKEYRAKNEERIALKKKEFAREHDEHEFKIQQYHKSLKKKWRK